MSSRIKKRFGTILEDNKFVKFQSSRYKTVKKPPYEKKMPENFNPITIWGEFLSPVQDQGDCSACWAIAAAKTLTDRYSLLTVGAFTDILSSYQMIMCDGTIFPNVPLDKDSVYQINLEAHTEGACNGNSLFTAADFIYSIGCVSESCVNKGLFKQYNIPDLTTIKEPESVPLCQNILGDKYDRCLDRNRAPCFYRSIVGYKIDSDVESIKQEIYKWGPVLSGFKIYDDFLNDYDGKTIYMGPKKNSIDNGGHAIEIVGWGRENGIDFWWICNSWSVKWGLSGYFKMKMNIKECGLETNAIGFIPDYPGFNMKMIYYPLQTSPDLIALRKWMDINQIYGYKNSVIPLIKQGKLKGDLEPIFNTRLPDMFKEYLGEINKSDIDSYYSVPHFVKSPNKSDITLLDILLFIIFFVVCYMTGKYLAIHFNTKTK